ncbi:MAG: proteasome-type protease [Planctomycetota bacterium]|nr:proteasome-type protease [Planctomycetota bacterium]
MTFCVGLRVRDGLIALGDTRIVKGDEHVVKSKLSFSTKESRQWWLMTSGLRSIRDKAVLYFEQESEMEVQKHTNLFSLANCFGEQLRRVRSEDGNSLATSNYAFNLHAILGGQLENDPSPKMFYIYPEGNWIDSSEESPYFIIGRTHYAKPILDRLLCFDTPLRSALALAYLAFDATRSSVTDVDFPVDIILSNSLQGKTSFQRFHEKDLSSVSDWWNHELASLLLRFPTQPFDSLFEQKLKGDR